MFIFSSWKGDCLPFGKSIWEEGVWIQQCDWIDAVSRAGGIQDENVLSVKWLAAAKSQHHGMDVKYKWITRTPHIDKKHSVLYLYTRGQLIRYTVVMCGHISDHGMTSCLFQDVLGHPMTKLLGLQHEAKSRYHYQWPISHPIPPCHTPGSTKFPFFFPNIALCYLGIVTNRMSKSEERVVLTGVYCCGLAAHPGSHAGVLRRGRPCTADLRWAG